MDPDTPHPLDGEPPEPEETSGRFPGFPFTPGGVASFAHTGWSRLFTWQLAVSIALGGSILLVLSQHWAPVMNQAIEKHMPPKTGLKEGRLIWPDDEPKVFGHNQYLCLAVNPDGTGDHGHMADVQIELQRDSWVCQSIFGYLEFEYPMQDWPLTRKEFVPWWGSRRPFLLLGSAVVVGFLFWLGWLGLGFAGIWPIKTVAYYTDLESEFGKLWRMSAASLLPAGMLLAMGVLCYSTGFMKLAILLILIPLHLVFGGVYLFFSLFSLPKVTANTVNPFDENSSINVEDEKLVDADSTNPFAGDNEKDS
jgi:hypothetical protein